MCSDRALEFRWIQAQALFESFRCERGGQLQSLYRFNEVGGWPINLLIAPQVFASTSEGTFRKCPVGFLVNRVPDALAGLQKMAADPLGGGMTDLTSSMRMPPRRRSHAVDISAGNPR